MKAFLRKVAFIMVSSVGLFAQSNVAVNLSLGSVDIEYQAAPLLSVELLGGYPMSMSATTMGVEVDSSYYSGGARLNLFTADALNSESWFAPRLYLSGFYRYYVFDFTAPSVATKTMQQLGVIVGTRTILFGRAHVDLGVGIANVNGDYFDYLSAQGLALSSIVQNVIFSIPIDVRFGWAF